MEAAREHNLQHTFLWGECCLSRSLVCEEECCSAKTLLLGILGVFTETFKLRQLYFLPRKPRH